MSESNEWSEDDPVTFHMTVEVPPTISQEDIDSYLATLSRDLTNAKSVTVDKHDHKKPTDASGLWVDISLVVRPCGGKGGGMGDGDDDGDDEGEGGEG